VSPRVRPAGIGTSSALSGGCNTENEGTGPRDSGLVAHRDPLERDQSFFLLRDPWLIFPIPSCCLPRLPGKVFLLHLEGFRRRGGWVVQLTAIQVPLGRELAWWRPILSGLVGWRGGVLQKLLVFGFQLRARGLQPPSQDRGGVVRGRLPSRSPQRPRGAQAI